MTARPTVTDVIRAREQYLKLYPVRLDGSAKATDHLHQVAENFASEYAATVHDEYTFNNWRLAAIRASDSPYTQSVLFAQAFRALYPQIDDMKQQIEEFNYGFSDMLTHNAYMAWRKQV